MGADVEMVVRGVGGKAGGDGYGVFLGAEFGGGDGGVVGG